MDLELSSFEKAVGQFSAGLARATAEPGDELVRDGAIQRFKYSYELSHRMLRRFLTVSEPGEENVREMSFQNLVRLGLARGLLNENFDRWNEYRDARRTASQAFDAEKAAAVLATLPDFLRDASFLLAQLKARAKA